MTKSDRPYWLIVTGGLAVLATLVSAPILTSWLGPSGRGIAYTAIAVGSLGSSVFALGVTTSLRIQYTRQTGRLSSHNSLHMLWASLAIFIFAGTFYLLDFGKTLSGQDVLLVASAASFALVASFYSAVLVARHRFLTVGLVGLLAPGLQLLIALFAGPLEPDQAVTLILASYLVSALASAVITWAVSFKYRRREGNDRIRVQVLASVRNMAPQAVQLFQGRLDLLGATVLFGASFGGQYSLALMVAIPILLIQPALLSPYLSIRISEWSSSPGPQGPDTVHQLQKIWSLGVLLGVGCAIAGSLLVIPFFGPEFSEVIYLCWFTVGSAVLALLVSFTSDLLVLSGQGLRSLKNLLVSLAIFIILAVISVRISEVAFPWTVLFFNLLLLAGNLRILGISPFKLRLSVGAAVGAIRDLGERSN